MKTITLFEHNPTKVGEQGLTDKHLSYLQRINEGKQGEIIKVGYNKIVAKQFVGFIRIKNITIQVLPKLCKDSEEKEKGQIIQNLLYMLQYTRRLKIKETNVSHIHKIKSDFFEILIYLFAKNLIEIIQSNLHKQYVERKENLNCFRGKLLITDNIKINITSKHKFYCEYDEFTEDNHMNRILKFTIEILREISTDNDNQRLLSQLSLMFTDVSLRRITLRDFDKLHFSRLNEVYSPIVGMCKLFIENSSVKLTAGRFETFSFMFDMNKLFEEFVYEFLRRHKEKLSITTVTRRGYYLTDNPKKFKLKPDILVTFDGGQNILIDTKYKILDEDDRKLGVSSSDMYQIFAYCVKWDSDKEKSIPGVLLFPKIEVNDAIQCYEIKKPNEFDIYIKLISIQEKIKDKRGLITEFNEIFADILKNHIPKSSSV